MKNEPQAKKTAKDKFFCIEFVKYSVLNRFFLSITLFFV